MGFVIELEEDLELKLKEFKFDIRSEASKEWLIKEVLRRYFKIGDKDGDKV